MLSMGLSSIRISIMDVIHGCYHGFRTTIFFLGGWCIEMRTWSTKHGNLRFFFGPQFSYPRWAGPGNLDRWKFGTPYCRYGEVLVGGFKHGFYFPQELGWSNLTNSYFSGGLKPPTRVYLYGLQPMLTVKSVNHPIVTGLSYLRGCIQYHWQLSLGKHSEHIRCSKGIGMPSLAGSPHKQTFFSSKEQLFDSTIFYQ